MKTSLSNSYYSNAHPVMYSVASRKRVAIQAYEVISDFLRRRKLSNLSCLDVGCSTGIITSYLASYFKRTVGVDVDSDAITFANKNYKRPGLTFSVQNAQKLTLPSNNYDVVICQEVYENVQRPHRLLAEIHRILKPGGICYFTADNFLFPIESQYRIPFLLYLPDTVAAFILKLLGKKRFYLGHFKTYWGLRRLCKKFIIHDYTLSVIRSPEKYKFTKLYKYKTIIGFVPNVLLSLLYFFLPTFIWVLEKENKDLRGKHRAKKRP